MLKKLLKYSWPPAIIAAIIFYLCCLIPSDDVPNSEIPHFDKIVHFCMYFGLSLVASSYYIYEKKGKVIILKLIIFAIIIPIFYGGLIEILQDVFFDRSGDWFDLLADMLGSLAALPFALSFRKLLLKQQEL
ncbi:VanZ family protein [Dysgonomonas sp. ZJ279]|uniref:VanZ family protein n=1 Tax=Dysgonomonas sp. ZJ279 TaxID=2709796 RepID=UPI0013EAFB07|nr:VanZ family protein [Dysgonomonas sp. ZJ279]